MGVGARRPGASDTRRGTWIAALALVAASAACASWNRHPASQDPAADDSAGAGRPLRLFLTGDTEGFLAPCGCEMSQFGGLPRRGGYLRKVRRPGDLSIDVGNLVAGGGPSPQITLDAALEALRTLQCDALVPGETEIRMADAFEDAVTRHPGLPVVCANLRRAADCARVFEPWLLRRLPDGRSVAVVGVAEPFAGTPARYRIAPLDETVRDAVAELRGAADVVVVAGGLHEESALALAAKFPDLALVVGGTWNTQGSRHAVTTAGAPAMLVGEFAWYVGRVDFDDHLRVAGSWQAWLDDGLPDDPDVAGLVARWKAAVSQENEGFAVKLVGALRAQGYAGSESCAECHAAEFATWKASAHARAMPTLAQKHAESDPSCIACHLQDVPRDPAAPPATLELGLGCEGCHGGAARHAALARDGAKSAGALAPATRDACLRCHVPPNATHFDFDADWPKIAHGPARAR